MTETLARDVFPAEVLAPDGRMMREARVFVTNARMVVATHNGHDVTFETANLTQPVTPDRSSLMGSLAVHTDAGVFYVNRARGCGCASPLKNYAAPYSWTAR